jgi:hypothetical protein
MQRKQEAYSISPFLLSIINIDYLSFISIIENLFKKREIGKKKWSKVWETIDENSDTLVKIGNNTLVLKLSYC